MMHALTPASVYFHLIDRCCPFFSGYSFNRFDFPPIFHRKEDTNPEQLWVRINFYFCDSVFCCLVMFNTVCASNLFVNQREGGRPPIPRKKPLKDMEKEPLVSDHPFVDTVFSKNIIHMPLTAYLVFYILL